MTRLLATFAAPRRYVQGPGALRELATLRDGVAERPVAIVDADVLPLVEDQLKDALGGGAFLILPFRGEITYAEIDRLRGQLGDHAPDLVIGMGGGKGLDVAKGVAKAEELPYVAVPTIASNDSPTGRSMAIYDENHTMVAVDFIPNSPVLVVVDTALIAKAPARFLRSGMGDAIAKKFEAEQAHRYGSKNGLGGGQTRTALAIADLCYRTLREFGVAALAAADRHEPDEAFEAVVEANILMAGLSWESGGVSYAHAVVRGLVQARGVKSLPHGEHVAYGTLVQLAIEGRPDAEIAELGAFLREVGLPASLADMTMTDATDAEIDEIARLTTIGPKNGMIEVRQSPAAIAAAIRRVEALA